VRDPAILPPWVRGLGSGVRPPTVGPSPTRRTGARDVWRGARKPNGAGPWILGFVAVVVTLLAGVAQAEVRVHAEVSAERIGLDDQVQYTIVVEGRGADLVEDPKLPPVDNLRLVGGPSTSTQVSIVNGSISQSRSYTYLLQPLQIGQAQIGAARLLFSDGQRTTAPISIQVVQGSVAPPAARQGDPFADMFGQDPFEQMMARRRAQPTGKVFIEADASRRSLYVGEPLLLTYYLYTQTRISGIDFEEAPKYQGFWAEDLPRSDDALRPSLVTREGETFQRVAVFRRLLYPTQPGTLTIAPARFRLGVPVQIGFWADPGSAAQMLSRTTNPIEVTVKPVPGDPGFSGAVGSFRVSSTIDRSDLAIGDAATLRFRVEGRGNLKWVDKAPPLSVPGAKVYPPQSKSDLKATEAGITGSRTWEYVIVPETAGRLTVPAQQLAYFDPGTGQIVQANTSPLTLEVRPAAAPAVAAGAQAVAAAAGGTGLHLRSELDLPTPLLPGLGYGALGLLAAAVLVLHGSLLGGRLLAGRTRRGAAPEPRRSPRQSLAELRRASRGGMSKEAAALLIERTLVDVFGPMDERENGDHRGEKESAVREVLHEVRFIRYAPQLGDYSEKIREVADRAAEVVRRWA
jgi:hypothetical protein